MRTKRAGMLVLGVGFVIWSCGGYDATSLPAGSDESAGSGGSGAVTSQTGGDSSLAAGGSGASSTGGSAMGGAALGGSSAGGAATGGAALGGSSAGGAATGGAALGGSSAGGQATGGSGTGGQGTGGSTDITGPCDIYAAANTPCVGAYSMVRVLSSTYSGPLYQVRSGAPNADRNTGSGGTTHDIGMTADGFADAAQQDAVCNGTTCTVSILYDQSGRGNHLTVAPAGCYTGGDGAAAEPDYESSATRQSLTAGGHNVYGLYMNAHEGYRNNQAVGTAEGEESQGVYMVADGTHYGVACCWDFGTASRDNCYGPTGMMATLLFGTAWWGRGEGGGPWFMGDFEGGVWAGGSSVGDPGYGSIEACDANDVNCPPNNDNPSLPVPYAFGILETSAGQYALRMGDATSGNLHTAYDGPAPQPWVLEGGIILGIGGDNSNWSYGTFFEGAITASRPSVENQEAVYRNVQEAGYGR
jgi:hypothetical protein